MNCLPQINRRLRNARSMCIAGIILALAPPISAQDALQDATVEAGRLIYEAVTNRHGCVRCHGSDGLAHEEGKMFAAERSIQGKTAQEVRIAIMATPMMYTIKLTDEELQQVAAYLAFLQDAAD